MSPSRYAALLILAGSAVLGQAQSVTLRLKPPVGKAFSYATNTTIKMVGGQSSTMTQAMNIVMRATSAAAGKITIESTIQSVKVGGDGPAASAAPNIEKQLKGKKSTIIVDSQGKPLGANGPQMMQQMMQGGLSNTYFPSQPVSVGSKWSNTIDLSKMVPAQGGMKVTGGKMPVNMTLRKFETRGGKRIAVIDMAMATTMAINGASPAQSMKMNLNTTGTTWIDVATGMPVESRTNAVTSSSFGGRQMNQNITSTMKLK
jgi:hypothetical protein